MWLMLCKDNEYWAYSQYGKQEKRKILNPILSVHTGNQQLCICIQKIMGLYRIGDFVWLTHTQNTHLDSDKCA